MRLPTISVALATYNGAAFIQDQLNSYVAQSRLPDELIVSDDRSSDDTVEIVERFARLAPFRVIIQQNETNLGFTQNFAHALSHCSGDLVLLSDQDDVWFPNKVARLIEFARNEPEAWLLTHDGEFANERLERTGLTSLTQAEAGFGSIEVVATGMLTMVRKEFLKLALPIPEGVIGHDVWLHRLCRAFPDRRVYLRESLQLIRRHADNVSSWIVSSPKRINRWSVLRDQTQTEPAKGYHDRLTLNEGLRSRIARIMALQNKQDRLTAEMAISDLKREASALYSRQNLVGSGTIRRRIEAIKMLRRGDYGQFNGWRSFLRDMVR